MQKPKQGMMCFLWEIIKTKKYSMLLLILVQLFVGVSGVLLALKLRTLIDCAVERNPEGFWLATGWFIVLIVAQIGAKGWLRILEEYTKAYLEAYLKKRLLNGLLHENYVEVTAVHSGEWLMRLTSDTVVVSEGLVGIFPGAVGMLVRLIAALVMLLTFLPWMSGWMVIIAIGMLFLTYILRKPLKVLHKEQQEADSAVRIILQEQLKGFMVLKIFGAEDYCCKMAAQYIEKHCERRKKRAKWSVFCSVGFSMILRGIYLAGAISCGQGILMGSISYGTLTAVLQLVTQLQAPLSGVTGYIPKFYALLASTERIMKAENFHSVEIKLGVKDILELQLENVSFAYPKEAHCILNDVSLNIKKGEMVAFIGNSGSGKSTLMKLILGLYSATKGNIRFISEAGQVLQEEACSYVPQGKYLMHGTIREIICLGNAEANDSEERLDNAIRAACADFVWELESGVDTELGEQGAGLSEGQLQRLSIARALYAKRQVLILDEATSALDEKIEWQVLSNIRKLKDRIVLVVTHRPAALKVCDRVIDFNEERWMGEME